MAAEVQSVPGPKSQSSFLDVCAKQNGCLSDEGMLATAEESGPRKYTLRVGRASTGEVHPSVRERFCAVICLTRGLLGAADMRFINALMCLGGCEVQLCGF